MSHYNLRSRAYQARYEVNQKKNTPISSKEHAIGVFVNFYKDAYDLDLAGKIKEKHLYSRFGCWHCKYGKLTLVFDDVFTRGTFHIYFEEKDYYSPNVKSASDIGQNLIDLTWGRDEAIDLHRRADYLENKTRHVWELHLDQYNGVLDLKLEHELLHIHTSDEYNTMFVVKFAEKVGSYFIETELVPTGGTK